MFVSSYACSPETAAYDFKYTLDHCRENSPNKAYHLIQAFALGEVGFEEAHRIGKELADKLLEGKYSYAVTTHIDKGHVHNLCKQSIFLIARVNQKGVKEMANRKRTHPVQFYLDDDEQYILDEKFRVSGMKSKSAFLRKLILYGYVYDVDYSYLRNYNTELGRISSNLNQIAKRINSTGNIYKEDMDEVKELMNEVWRTQKSMLSKQPLIK